MKSLVITATALTALSLIVASAFVGPAFALKNLFNCITNAGNDGKLTFQEYTDCFNKVFHKQLSESASLSNPDVSVTP